MQVAAGALLDWRALIIWGEEGIGKSAFSREFCRFFSAPGGRLFSAGAFILDSSHLHEPHSSSTCSFEIQFARALLALLSAWNSKGSEVPPEHPTSDPWDSLRIATARFDASGRWLLVVDSVEADNVVREGELIRALQRLTAMASQVCIMVALRTPSQGLGDSSRWARLGDCKVVKIPVPALHPLAAAKLFAFHVQRMLRAQDFSIDTSHMSGDPGVQSWAELLTGTPVMRSLRGVPRRIVSAAGKVDYRLQSLFEHPDIVHQQQGKAVASTW
jgi:hypothetical protein